MFAKYASQKGGLTKWDIFNVMNGQRVLFDPFGAFGGLFECWCWLPLFLRL